MRQFGAGRGCQSMMFSHHGHGHGRGADSGPGGFTRGLRATRAKWDTCGLRGGRAGGLWQGGFVRGILFGWRHRARSPGSEVAEFTGASGLKKSRAGKTHGARRGRGGGVRADALALAIWREVGERLGEALALFIDVLNPERIVIGSIYQRCERFIAPAVKSVIAREALPDSARDCAIVPAQLGDELGQLRGGGDCEVQGPGVIIPRQFGRSAAFRHDSPRVGPSFGGLRCLLPGLSF